MDTLSSIKFHCLSTQAAVAASALALVVAFSPHAEAQSSKSLLKPPTIPTAQHETADQRELSRRMLEAEQVRSTGDPSAIVRANHLLIALRVARDGQDAFAGIDSGAIGRVISYFAGVRGCSFNLGDLARASLMAGNADEAIAEAEKALKTEPDNVSVYLTLGRAYGGKREHEKAAAALEHAERLQPSI